MIGSSIVKKNSKALAVPTMLVLLIVVFIFSLGIGAVRISGTEIISLFLHKMGLMNVAVEEVKAIVLYDIRLPRIIQTTLIGAALGASGAALQGIFRNPLVEPGLIGISAGAAGGAVMVIIFGGFIYQPVRDLLGMYLLPVFAFGGSLAATFAVYYIAKSVHKTNVTLLILAGVAVTALGQAFIGLAIFYADDTQIRTYSFWILGDLSSGTWEKIINAAPLIILPLVFILRQSRSLNAISIGEAEAYHMGVDVEKVKYIIIVLSALAVGTAVSLAGIIAFVGLVIPHLVRLAFGPDHKIVLAGSALGGGILLLVADIIARMVVSPAELPIGIVTAMLGSPFFIYLLLTAKRKRII